jgi:hypothetical protein
MASVILTHLGDSVPSYIRECVHQLRIWNPLTPVYIILEPVHHTNSFWSDLTARYSGVHLVYTDTLAPTAHHAEFRAFYRGDTTFRRGYWKYVRERFFYVEELMARDGLTHCISMEYDVLVYHSLDELQTKLKSSHQTLRMVMDTDTRGHPAFLYIPTVDDIKMFSIFMTAINGMPYEDMQALALYSKLFPVHYLPVISADRNAAVRKRVSITGAVAPPDVSFLSEDSEHFGVLFDSLVVGQWLGGIDSRNTGGEKIVNYENEAALYSIREMRFAWEKVEGGKWKPFLDNRPLVTIHVHSKALSCFLSDRGDCPTGDYDVRRLYTTLEPN